MYRVQPILRLVVASAIYTTYILDSSEEVTISLSTKVELTLVFTTLRDTSFKYTTQYSFNTLLISKGIRIVIILRSERIRIVIILSIKRIIVATILKSK